MDIGERQAPVFHRVEADFICGAMHGAALYASAAIHTRTGMDGDQPIGSLFLIQVYARLSSRETDDRIVEELRVALSLSEDRESACRPAWHRSVVLSSGPCAHPICPRRRSCPWRPGKTYAGFG